MSKNSHINTVKNLGETIMPNEMTRPDLDSTSKGRSETDKVRLNLVLSGELSRVLDEIADSASATRTDVIRQALALINVAHRAKKEGRHIGLVVDQSKLDTEIVGLL
jgi:hypothetical protein